MITAQLQGEDGGVEEWNQRGDKNKKAIEGVCVFFFFSGVCVCDKDKEEGKRRKGRRRDEGGRGWGGKRPRRVLTLRNLPAHRHHHHHHHSTSSFSAPPPPPSLLWRLKTPLLIPSRDIFQPVAVCWADSQTRGARNGRRRRKKLGGKEGRCLWVRLLQHRASRRSAIRSETRTRRRRGAAGSRRSLSHRGIVDYTGHGVGQDTASVYVSVGHFTPFIWASHYSSSSGNSV